MSGSRDRSAVATMALALAVVREAARLRAIDRGYRGGRLQCRASPELRRYSQSRLLVSQHGHQTFAPPLLSVAERPYAAHRTSGDVEATREFHPAFGAPSTSSRLRASVKLISISRAASR